MRAVRLCSANGSGFTLVELLIAIGLVGMILVILFSALRIASRSAEALEARVVASEDLRVVHAFLRRQIAQARAVFSNDPDKGRVLAFDGEPGHLEFVGPMLTHLGYGGLYRQRLEFVDAAEGPELAMRWRPEYVIADYPEDDWEEARLGEAGVEGEFSYFGADEPGDTASWRADWKEKNELPRAIRITFGGDRERWPEILVTLDHRVGAQQESVVSDYRAQTARRNRDEARDSRRRIDER